LEIVGIEIRNPIFNKQLEPIGIWKTINDKDTKEIIDLMLNKNERYAKGGYLEGYISLKPIAEIRIKTNKNRYETWNSQGNIIHIKNKYYEIDSEYIKIIDKYLKE
jgi:hypothetical protein